MRLATQAHAWWPSPAVLPHAFCAVNVAPQAKCEQSDVIIHYAEAVVRRMMGMTR
jgi:hypothetical protein